MNGCVCVCVCVFWTRTCTRQSMTSASGGPHQALFRDAATILTALCGQQLEQNFSMVRHTHAWECVYHDACSSSLCVPSPPPETMAQAPTDIGARLVSTPIKYNYMKTVYPRYPATKLKFQCVPLTQSITSAICICICLCYSVVQTAAGGTCSANYFGACLFVWLFRRQV